MPRPRGRSPGPEGARVVPTAAQAGSLQHFSGPRHPAHLAKLPKGSLLSHLPPPHSPGQVCPRSPPRPPGRGSGIRYQGSGIRALIPQCPLSSPRGRNPTTSPAKCNTCLSPYPSRQALRKIRPKDTRAISHPGQGHLRSLHPRGSVGGLGTWLQRVGCGSSGWQEPGEASVLLGGRGGGGDQLPGGLGFRGPT